MLHRNRRLWQNEGVRIRLFVSHSGQTARMTPRTFGSDVDGEPKGNYTWSGGRAEESHGKGRDEYNLAGFAAVDCKT